MKPDERCETIQMALRNLTPEETSVVFFDGKGSNIALIRARQVMHDEQKYAVVWGAKSNTEAAKQTGWPLESNVPVLA